MTTLSANAVNVDVGSRALLAGLDLDVPCGLVTLLVGRNGSGKTTLLNVLGGLREPEAGRVELDGQDVRSMDPRERARRVTVIPQDSDSPFEFTGRELVMMGRHPHIARFGSPAAADQAAVDRALDMADAVEFADRPITTLSGGERQRVSVARALATEAEIVLADEPTANLDLDHALALLDLFRGLASAGRTVVLVSHDLNLTAPAADRVAILHDGQIRCVSEPSEALAPDTLREVFGVNSEQAEGYFPRRFTKL